MNTNIWWIRRDLRLADNQALAAATENGSRVVPVFVLDPVLLASPYVGPNRLAFLLGGLKALDEALRRRGSYLVLREGRVLEELALLVGEIEAAHVYAEKDFSPYAIRRDAAVGHELPLELVDGVSIHNPEIIYKSDGSPYTVFTPFSLRWKQQRPPDSDSLIPMPRHIATPPGISGIPIPEHPRLPVSVPFVPGEKEAQHRLSKFTEATGEALINRYADDRNRMDMNGTSMLSPYLRFGMFSVRQAVVATVQNIPSTSAESAGEGAAAWKNELIWRDFYMHILFHFPFVLKEGFRPAYRNIEWRNDVSEFTAWCDGQTGYPIVDAAMRQLLQTGWMHNRARMIVASFLVKDLLIDWRWGERWFMQHLVDGDPAANNGGWQWTAGTGTDAAPYFRIFNPVRQGKRFDPNGDYVRRWLPELIRVPNRYMHSPWKMPREIQQDIECTIGRHYPQPIVDHVIARQVTLEAYARARSQSALGG